MKVVLLLASPYPAPRGSQVLVQQTEHGLRRRGHEVTVVSYGRWLRHRTGFHPARPLLDLLTFGRVVYHLVATRADVLHAHNYQAGMIGAVAARLLGVPLVFHGHSRMEEELPSYADGRVGRRVLARFGAWLDRTVPRAADHCIAVTPVLADTFRHHGCEAVSMIRPVADPDEIDALGTPDPPAPEPTLCYAGNLDRYQNLSLLAAAFQRVRHAIPEARLLVVTHARAAAPPMSTGVDVARVESPVEAWRAIGRAWVTVVPRVDPSGHPMKVLNYLAAGKPVVATRGAAQGLRDGVDALVVADDDVDAFASAIVELLRNGEQRALLGTAARDTASSRVAWDASLIALEAAYGEACRRRGRSRRSAPAREET